MLLITELTLILPNDVASAALNAGLLSPVAIEAMLRNQLRRNAGEQLRQVKEQLPDDEINPGIEQEILDAVKAVRAERRALGQHS